MKNILGAWMRLLQCVRAAFFFVLLFVFSSSHINAQGRWKAELRTGINVPTKKLGGTELNTGFGFDAAIGYRMMPHLYLQTAWGWNHFSAANTNIDYEETGYLVGVQFVHPIDRSNLSYIVGAGAIYKHLEMENNEGNLLFNTGHGWGWQADAGLGIQLGQRTRLVPFVRYHLLTRDVREGSIVTPAELQYLAGGIGISWNF